MEGLLRDPYFRTCCDFAHVKWAGVWVSAADCLLAATAGILLLVKGSHVADVYGHEAWVALMVGVFLSGLLYSISAAAYFAGVLRNNRSLITPYILAKMLSLMAVASLVTLSICCSLFMAETAGGLWERLGCVAGAAGCLFAFHAWHLSLLFRSAAFIAAVARHEQTAIETVKSVLGSNDEEVYFISKSEKDSGKGRVLGMVAHVVSFALPALIGYVALSNFSFFSLHPICMAIAYGLLLNEAIQVFSPSSSLVSGGQKRKVNIHGYTLLGALLLALVGFGVIYWNKAAKGSSHFTTWHGLIGVITVGYSFIQVVAGTLIKYAGAFNWKLPANLKLAEVKLYHSLSGCLLYMLAAAALFLGIYSTWFQSHTGDVMWGAAAVGCVLLWALGLNHLNFVVKDKAPRVLRAK